VPLHWWVGKSQEHVAPAGDRLSHEEAVSLVASCEVEGVAIELGLQQLDSVYLLRRSAGVQSQDLSVGQVPLGLIPASDVATLDHVRRRRARWHVCY
jgi:hypothetical protein